MCNDFLNDDVRDIIIERDGFKQQVEDLIKILKGIQFYLMGRFNETQDTKYLDDLIKLQEMCGDYYDRQSIYYTDN